LLELLKIGEYDFSSLEDLAGELRFPFSFINISNGTVAGKKN
jgi:hypothetical protein